MTQNPLIGASGWFPSVSFHDETLSDHFSISTLNSDGIGCQKNVRIVRVPFCADPSRIFVAVSGYVEPYPIQVYDVNSQQKITNCLGHHKSVYGLTCLSSTDSSNPRIVSGGRGDRQVLVFDALEGTKLCALPDPYTSRILHVPEWNSHSDVFVGGGGGKLFHYDLTRPDRKLGSFVGHSDFVDGLSANVTKNILFSASDDNTVRMWSQNDYSCQRTINLSNSAYSCCYMKERNLLIVGLDNEIELFDIRRLSDDDVPVQKVKLGSWGDIDDIGKIDENRFVCGCGRGLVVCELPSGQVLHRTDLPGYVYGVCVFPECLPIQTSSSTEPEVEVVPLSRRISDDIGIMREKNEVEELRCLVEGEVNEFQRQSSQISERKERIEELTQALEAKDRLLEEKERGFRQSLQEKEREKIERESVIQQKETKIEELQSALREKEIEFRCVSDEKIKAEAILLQNETEILELRSDGLSTRMRDFVRCLDTQRVYTLDLSERYLRQGRIDSREHILKPSEFSLAQATGDGRFAFRDVWFSEQRNGMSLVPFEFLEYEEASGMLSIAETVIVDLFNDSSLCELILDESDVSRDDILDLQEEWDEFYRTDPVYDTAKVMEACEETTRRKVSFVVSRIFDFFGGEVNDELVCQYEGRFRVGSDCLLGCLKSCGLGRHRSLCFKLVCDRLSIPCRLIRGWRTCSVDGLTVYDRRIADAWCIVNLCDRLHFVDLVSTGTLLAEFVPDLCDGRKTPGSVPDVSVDVVQFSVDYPGLPKDLLGHGGFGQAFAVEYGDDCVAVKEVNLSQRIAKEGPVANARVRRELNLMSSFHHPNIVPTFGSFQFVRRSVVSRRRRMATRTASGGGGETIIGIVMPLYDHNASVVREILRRADSLIALRETLFLLLSVANGLRYLHSLSILHLDMKPDNVLVSVNEEEFTLSEIRICDFGGSRPHCTLMSLSALPVSLGFCSPEVKQAADGDKTIVLDESADVYSFGALMRFYRCYFGTFRELYELCDRCMCVERGLRPNLIEVMSVLRSHLLFVDTKKMMSD